MMTTSSAVTHFTAATPPQIRFYKVWKGRNKFLCGGRLVFGPDGASVLLSTFLIGTPALTFCVRMLLRLSQVDSFHGHAVLAVGLVLTFLDLIFLFMTSSTNPGIVPRNYRAPDTDDSSTTSTSMDWLNSATPELKLPRTKDLLVNGHTIKVKYCDTCLLYRPPRASHCSICNNCVQRFDHHCPWVGQCIGVRNYRCFIMFINTSTILCIYVFTFSVLNIIDEPGSVWRSMSKDIVSVFLIAYCFVAVWFVGGLSVFHFYLMCTNQTTYENFRYRYDKKENPYNKSVVKNLREIFLSKTPPSLVDFRKWVNIEEEDSTNLESMSHKFRGDVVNRKAMFDLELGGGKPGKDGSSYHHVPEGLQKIDYSAINDKLKKEGGGNFVFDPFLSPTCQESKDEHLRTNNKDSGLDDDCESQDTSHRVSAVNFER